MFDCHPREAFIALNDAAVEGGQPPVIDTEALRSYADNDLQSLKKLSGNIQVFHENSTASATTIVLLELGVLALALVTCSPLSPLI